MRIRTFIVNIRFHYITFIAINDTIGHSPCIATGGRNSFTFDVSAIGSAETAGFGAENTSLIAGLGWFHLSFARRKMMLGPVDLCNDAAFDCLHPAAIGYIIADA